MGREVVFTRKREYLPFADFYVPTRKEEFVKYFTSIYPGVVKSKWMHMPRRRLMAIYFAIRTRRG